MSKNKTSGWVKLIEVVLLVGGAIFAIFATKKATAKSKSKKTSVKVTAKKSSSKKKK